MHPTGFVDPKQPDAKVKTLCAELLRGVGGILVDAEGRRFANELGTRDYIVGRWDMFCSSVAPFVWFAVCVCASYRAPVCVGAGAE